MAEKLNKLSENVAGKFYVDDSCAPCRTCMEVEGIGKFLSYNDDETYVYFIAQPSNAEEEAICLEAMSVCAPGAIGDDGDE